MQWSREDSKFKYTDYISMRPYCTCRWIRHPSVEIWQAAVYSKIRLCGVLVHTCAVALVCTEIMFFFVQIYLTIPLIMLLEQTYSILFPSLSFFFLAIISNSPHEGLCKYSAQPFIPETGSQMHYWTTCFIWDYWNHPPLQWLSHKI